ncbi:MAG: Mfa1 family fimbria major subunit [Mediterranea sp.]|jgi:uncharacterized protein YxeA|nr:Mfa1 family fimbria major subunit [Mediterranea sp.]
MKKIRKNLLLCVMSLLTSITISSCSNDEPAIDQPASKVTTHVGFSVKLPQTTSVGGAAATRYDAGNYNADGTYEGVDLTSRIDLYLISADGALLDSRRFDYTELTWLYQDGMQVVQPKEPFQTTAGEKYAVVVINSPYPLISTTPASDYLISITNEFPLSAVGQFVSYDGERVLQSMFSGRSEVTTITDGVTAADVKAGANRIELMVERMVSRVIVTASPQMDANSSEVGTFSEITYSVAQGSKAVYLFPQIEGEEYKTYGYDYLPDENYIRTSAAYYCYDDLQVTTDVVPVNPSTDADQRAYLNVEGKLLLENTHATYLKGNTAYVLVRAKFTPHAEAIVDGGALAADGTFYVGATDGNIYSSVEAATDPSVGTAYQNVLTYVGGKTLYYVWLNPDNIEKPTVSPVMRNNIYHININSFKQLGTNWNPLTPDINNPDPKPDGPEPPSPVDPTDPLSSTDTYMSVDIQVKDWTVHSYDVDL